MGQVILKVFPTLYGTVVYQIFLYKLKPVILILVLFIQTLLLVVLMETIGFAGVSIYGYAFVFLLLCLYLFKSAKVFLLTFFSSAKTTEFVRHTFLFAIYIGLCLMVNRAHPFAKYTMFNKFSDYTYVFLLKDNTGQTIILKDYCKMDGNQIYEMYVAEDQKYGYVYSRGIDEGEGGTIIYREMMGRIFKNLKKPLPSDSVSLNVIKYHVADNKLNIDEKQLYKCKVQ